MSSPQRLVPMRSFADARRSISRRDTTAGGLFAAVTVLLVAVAPVLRIELWVFGVEPTAVGVPTQVGSLAALPVVWLAGLLVWAVAVPDRPAPKRGAIAGFYASMGALLLAVAIAVPGWIGLALLPGISTGSIGTVVLFVPLFATLPLFWLFLITFPVVGACYEWRRSDPRRLSPLVDQSR